MAALFAHISAETPALTARRSELDPAVDQVFARVLAKDPADRYTSCQEFADALRQALGVQPYAIHGQMDRPLTPSAEPAAPEKELAAPVSADLPAAQEPRRKKRAPRRSGLVAAEVTAPDTVAVLTEDESPPAGDRHPSHPSHPSQLGQTTNLRKIRPAPDRSPGISDQETETAGAAKASQTRHQVQRDRVDVAGSR